MRLHLHGRRLQALPVPHSRVGTLHRLIAFLFSSTNSRGNPFCTLTPDIFRNAKHFPSVSPFLLTPPFARSPKVSHCWLNCPLLFFRQLQNHSRLFSHGTALVFMGGHTDTEDPRMRTGELYMAVVCVYPSRRIGARNHYQSFPKIKFFLLDYPVPGWVGDRPQAR
jgi:hypothetical protein